MKKKKQEVLNELEKFCRTAGTNLCCYIMLKTPLLDLPSNSQQIAKGEQNGKFDGFGKDDHRLPKKQTL